MEILLGIFERVEVSQFIQGYFRVEFNKYCIRVIHLFCLLVPLFILDLVLNGVLVVVHIIFIISAAEGRESGRTFESINSYIIRMGEYYTYTKKRKEFGKVCNFSDTEIKHFGFFPTQ